MPIRPTYIVFFVTLVSCGAQGPTRTDLSEWATVELPAEGVRLTAPAEAFNLQMHPQRSGLGDATWGIVIEVERKDRSYFELPMIPQPGDRGYSDPKYVSWLNWLKTFHPTMSEFHMGDNTKQYRRDIQLPNGAAICTRVTYRYGSFTQEERAVDTAAIERILLSAQPIPPQASPNKKRPSAN